MRPRLRRVEARGHKSHHRAPRIHRNTIQTGRSFHSTALDVCVVSSDAAVARGDAAQAAFEREKHTITDGEFQTCVPRHRVSLPGLDSGRPTTPSSHTNFSVCSRHRIMSQRATNVSKSLQHRWKHRIQIALLRRRAAMTQTVLPNTSARERWLLAGFIDNQPTSHWI